MRFRFVFQVGNGFPSVEYQRFLSVFSLVTVGDGNEVLLWLRVIYVYIYSPFLGTYHLRHPRSGSLFKRDSKFLCWRMLGHGPTEETICQVRN
jgi:hypothetical protein